MTKKAMKEEHCLIGIDAGTSVVKAVAYDYSGSEICSHEICMELRRPQPSWVEQDMGERWDLDHRQRRESGPRRNHVVRWPGGENH